jgi:hypothetical protein
MARRAIGISAKWLKYIPQLAAVYAFYEYYMNVGFEGIKADIEAITFDGIKVQARNIVSGFAAFIIGDIIATKVRDRYIKTIVRAIAYYVGAKQLAAALDAGSAVSRVAAVTSGTTTTAGTAVSMRGY